MLTEGGAGAAEEVLVTDGASDASGGSGAGCAGGAGIVGGPSDSGGVALGDEMATAAVSVGTLRASAEFRLYPNQGAGAGAAVGAKVRSYLDEGADAGVGAGAGAGVLPMLNLAFSAWESPFHI